MQDAGTHHFVDAVLQILDEAIHTHHGFFLDPGESLFPTLAAISAAEASIPVSTSCASIAAQVKHTTYYLEVLRVRRARQMRNGAPTSAVTIPTCSSAGRVKSRPATSAAVSNTAPSTSE